MCKICEKAYEGGDIETIKAIMKIDERTRNEGKRLIERYEAEKREAEENYERREEVRRKYE